MEFIICLITVSFIFLIYLNLDKIIYVFFKNNKKNEIRDVKKTKREILGSPRRNK
jgi:hypothetical protein